MKRIIFGMMGIVFIFTLAGCETVKGMGKDLQNTGSNIHDFVTGADRNM